MKRISNEEALSLAQELNLTQYLDINNLIEDINIGQNREMNVCFVTNRHEVVEFLLSKYFDVHVLVNVAGNLKISIQYGEENYSTITKYGEIFIDKKGFASILTSQGSIESSISMKKDFLRNVCLNMVYVPEYEDLDLDTWRYVMIKSDKLIVALDANHILSIRELDFLNSVVLPYFSAQRLVVAIGNAQLIRFQEWADVVARVKMKLGETFEAIPLFTIEIAEENKRRYSERECDLDEILSDVQIHSLNLRSSHFNDIDAYRHFLLEQMLIELKRKTEMLVSSEEKSINIVKGNEDIAKKSRDRIESNIKLFLESPLLANFRKSLDAFAKIFCSSLQQDVDASKNIREDSRYIDGYLTEIWSMFVEKENAILLKKFESEASTLFDMMRVDIGGIARNIQNDKVTDEIRKRLLTEFNVHTFFARKTSSGNGLTDALTIGGVITAIFVSPIGWTAVAVSEILKLFSKNSLNEECKRQLNDKIEEIIYENKRQLISQAEMRFGQAAQDFHDEVMKYYDELLDSLRQVENQEEDKMANASKTLETINAIL